MSQTKGTKYGFFPSSRACGSNTVPCQLFISKYAKLGGAWQYCHVFLPLLYLLMYVQEPFLFLPYILMSGELGSATDIDRHFVSSGLSIPIFILIGNDDFWSCQTDIMANRRQKLIPLCNEFLGYLGEIKSDSRNVWPYIPHTYVYPFPKST